MSVVTKMYLEGKEYTVLNMKFEFDQPTDITNKPKSKTNGGLVNLTVETTMGTEFLHWVHSPDMKKNLILEISPSTKSSKSRIIELYDVYCCGLTEHFTSQTPQPMLTHLKLTAGIFKQGSVIHEKCWKTSTPASQNENTQVVTAPGEEKEKTENTQYRIDFEADSRERENGVFGFDYMFNHFKDSCTSGYAKLKEHYTPIDVDNEEYFVPWVSMRQGQTITLKLSKKPKKPDDFEKVEFDEHPDFTISPTNLKDAKEIQITCNNANLQTAQLTLKADNKPAGALNIFYPPPKKVKVRWVFVEVKGNLNDYKNLDAIVKKQKLIDSFKKAFNPALIDVEIVNKNADIVDISADKNEYYTRGYITNDPNVEGDFIEYKHKNMFLTLASGVVNDKKKEKGVVNIYFINYKCIDSSKIFKKGQYDMVGGVSPTGSGDAFMVLDDKGNMKGVNIVHEFMHALGLDHTFYPKNKHAFTLGKTDNYMDYKNSKKHTYKWQWEQLYNSKFSK